LIEIVIDKIFLTISNMYFFSLSREMHVDFSAAFYLVPALDFTNIFPARASVAQ
jgi:hypothetical protein